MEGLRNEKCQESNKISKTRSSAAQMLSKRTIAFQLIAEQVLLTSGVYLSLASALTRAASTRTRNP